MKKNLNATKRTRKVRRNRSRKAISFEPNSEKIDFIMNDMSTPKLMKKVSAPKLIVGPKFTVGQFKGGGFKPNQVEFQAANCYVSITNALNYFNSRTNQKLTRWAGTKDLQIFPRAGEDLNAYYNRKTLSFFYFSNPRIGTIYLSDSAEVVTHELGHAMLDSWRPDTWRSTGLEVHSFHESFADLTAMMHALTYREIVQDVIDKTQGNLHKPNVVSNLAEHVGQSVYRMGGSSQGYSNQNLRSAINDFKYVHPSKLPKKARHNKLAAECHSFGRIFLAAFYDILIMMYEDIKKENKWDTIGSLGVARDILTTYTIKAIQNAPLNTRFFESMAKTLLWADVTIGQKKYHDRMQQIFFDRNILEPKLNVLTDAPTCDNEFHIMSVKKKMNLKLSDYFIRMQSDNPLYDVDVEIHNEQAYLYDQKGNALDFISVDTKDAICDTQDTIIYLHETQSVSDSPLTPFEIKDGKLTRTHFSGGHIVL